MKKLFASALFATMMISSASMMVADDAPKAAPKTFLSVDTVKAAFTSAYNAVIGLPEYAKQHPVYVGIGGTALIGLFIMYKTCPWLRAKLGLDAECNDSCDSRNRAYTGKHI